MARTTLGHGQTDKESNMDNSIQKTTLYRYFDSEGELLYVGITGDNTKRQSQHRRNSFWFGEIATASFEHFDERATALEAETLAIRHEKPKYNIAGAGASGFKLMHSPYTHLIYLAGMPEGGHDELHREFVKPYQELFFAANGKMPTADSVLVIAMHFTRTKHPEFPNLTQCSLCQRAIQSEWYEQGLKDIKRIGK